MVLETRLHPGALKDMVASPGGTTIEGLHELERGQFRATLMNAVRAATDRARRIGQG
jgi:pyrroline-5-carboxylate reductase